MLREKRDTETSHVALIGMSTPLVLALMVCADVYAAFGYDCVVTSVTDSKHGSTSLHYAGDAIDLRTKHLKEGDAVKIHAKIRYALNRDFDVLLEGNHIHIEWQARYNG